MRPLSPNYAVNSSQGSQRLLCADRPSLGCRWVPSSHRRLLRPANRCCTDFGFLQRVLSLAGGASETVGACGNSPAGGGGGQLAVGVLPHSAASTHMHISPRSLRPHTAEARRRLPSTAGLAATLHPDPLEMVPGAAPWRSLPPGTKLLICLNSGCIF